MAYGLWAQKMGERRLSLSLLWWRLSREWYSLGSVRPAVWPPFWVVLTNLTRYVNLCVAFAPGISGTFTLPPTSQETASQRSRHASRHVLVGIANPLWWGKLPGIPAACATLNITYPARGSWHEMMGDTDNPIYDLDYVTIKSMV